MIPLRDTIPHEKMPLVTVMIILANVATFLYEVSLGPEEREVLFYLFGLVPARYTDAQWAEWVGLSASPLPFFTGMFLHGGWLHLIGNMWFMWIFGDNVEDRMGHFRFLVFYVLCGLGAALIHFWINYSSRIPTIGASGAIAGVLGAYFVMFPRSRIVALVPIFIFLQLIELPAFIFLGLWFLMQFLSATQPAGLNVGGIAFWAHVGGFVVGILAHRFFAGRRPRRARR